MLPAISHIANAIYVGAAQGAVLFAQAEKVDSANKFDTDVKSIAKLKALLAFLGLIILFIGMFLILWLISRHYKRAYLGEPKPPGNSPYSEFGYKYQGQRKPQKSDDIPL